MQVVLLSPLLVPIWVAGLVRLVRDPAIRWARSIALAYPVLCAAVLLGGGKPYYALPLLTVVIAAGCEPVARWSGDARRGRLLVAGILLAALVNTVVTLPVLPPGELSLVNGLDKEQGEQIGWPQLAEATAGEWSHIPADRRLKAVIFTQNYGEAGAIARYGPAHGLPAPYSGHMSYADWRRPPDSADGPVLLVRQSTDTRMRRYFTACQQAGRVDNGQGVHNAEQNAVIDLCTGTVARWSVIWPSLRRF
jgi:hypothetical protein